MRHDQAGRSLSGAEVRPDSVRIGLADAGTVTCGGWCGVAVGVLRDCTRIAPGCCWDGESVCGRSVMRAALSGSPVCVIVPDSDGIIPVIIGQNKTAARKGDRL
ncbi:hypothetical protein [Thalassospira sp.]|uniref:hypothetical protein n=1 Tax=Thalassospira sp. TaxID=1912094 RepID=UPI002732E002|nr:hypothetical protein [Thalassospira sp.]MDP2699469.1 hypothetical protein [Thalassospira sp.]